MARIRWVALLCLLLLLGLVPSGAQARRGLTTGFAIDSLLTADTPAIRAMWIPRAVSEGAGIARIDVHWYSVAPGKPPAGFDPSNPNSPGYNWSAYDGPIRDLASAGLKVMININLAPAWAQGPNAPSYAPPGTWKPNPKQFAAFAAAAATRYSGHFADPQHPGSSLPAVHYWQAWNEPNLDYYLSPQWTRTAHGYLPASPDIYRQLLNAFYAAVKGVSRSNFVIGAGTAPYGDQPGIDQPGTDRMPPVMFDRSLFCEANNKKLSAVSCPNPPQLDAVAHHPYAVGGPNWHALNPDDAAVADVYKIANVLKAAEREHHVLPRGHKQLWDTEISWDSNPPDPQGVPINRHARWVEQAMYVLWSQGVNTVLWLQIGDSAPVPDYASTYQAGMYFVNGSPKPAATALRFPFVTERNDSRTVQVWGRAPQRGKLRIEALRGHKWRTLHTIRVRPRQLFLTKLKLRGKATLRAQVGVQSSLTWQQGR